MKYMIEEGNVVRILTYHSEKASYLLLQVVEESRTYGDILQEDFVDSYMNLTLKSVMGLKWASTYCSQTQYLLKTDDDIFVNVPVLLTYLQEASKTRWITGE